MISQGQPEKVIPTCREAVHLAPKFAEAQKNLGLALTDAGHHDEAIAP